jgi:hypothetical protein
MPHPPVRCALQVVRCWCLSTLENFSTSHPLFLTDFHRIICFVSANTLFIFSACTDGYLPKFGTPLCHAIWSSGGACFLFYKVIGCRAWLPRNHQKKSCGIVCVCVCARVFCLVHFVWFPQVHFCQIGGTSRLPFYYLAILLDCHSIIWLYF